jgi:hypothetical protein
LKYINSIKGYRMQDMNYDQLIYLVEQAEEIETNIIRLLEFMENAPSDKRDRYLGKIKELEAKTSSIKNLIESYLKQG